MRSTVLHVRSNTRRFVLPRAAGAVLLGASLAATPAAAAPAPERPAAQSQAPGMTFTGDAGMILYSIKAEGAADFEAIIEKLKEALAKTEDPTRRSQAHGWVIFKAAEAAPGEALYVFLMNPVVKDADYNWARMFDVLPREDQAKLQELFEKFRTTVIRANKLNLHVLANFSGGHDPFDNR
jgi:hypothetical protein